MAALVTRATGTQPHFVGKPNPMMFRSAMKRIQAHSGTTVMVGGRMDTDVVWSEQPVRLRRKNRRACQDQTTRLLAHGAAGEVA